MSQSANDPKRTFVDLATRENTNWEINIETLVTQLFELYRAHPTGGICFLVLLSGVIIDQALNELGRQKLARAILGTTELKLILPKDVSLSRRVNINETFIAALDRLFAFRGKLPYLPSFWRTSVASLFVLVIFLSLSPDQLLADLKLAKPSMLVAVLLSNLVVDYLSMTQTRWLIAWASNQKRRWLYIVIVLVDALLSILLVLLAYMVVAALVSWQGLRVEDTATPNIFLNAMPGDDNVLVAAVVNFYDLFTTPWQYWTSAHQAHLTLILTNLTTSVWLWLFNLGTLIQSLLNAPRKVRDFVCRYTIFHTRPASISAAVVSLLLFLVLWPYKELILYTMHKSYSLEPQTVVITEPYDCGTWWRQAETPVVEEEFMAEIEPYEPFCNLVEIRYEVAADQSSVPRSAQESLLRLADMASRDELLVIRIEGHVERLGSREYNMAMAGRLTHAARDFLLAHGVRRDQVEERSYGEEMDAGLDPLALRPAHRSLRRVVLRVW